MVENPYPIPRQLRQSGILVGNGGDVYGPFDFMIFDPADVVVFACAANELRFTEVAGVTVTKVNGNTALNPLDAFTVKFPFIVPVSTRYVVLSSRVAARAAGVMSGTRINPDALEKEFSKIATQQQELRRDIGRAVMVEFGDNAMVIDAGLQDGDTLMKQGGRFTAGPNLPDLAESLIAEAAAEADRAKLEADRSDLHANRSRREADRAAGYVNDIVSEKEVPITGTRNGMQSLQFPTGMNSLDTRGFAALGDGGGRQQIRVPAEPAHGMKVRSADRVLPNRTVDLANGGWWEPSAGLVTIKEAGTSADWAAAAAAARSFAGSNGAIILEEGVKNQYGQRIATSLYGADTSEAIAINLQAGSAASPSAAREPVILLEKSTNIEPGVGWLSPYDRLFEANYVRTGGAEGRSVASTAYMRGTDGPSKELIAHHSRVALTFGATTQAAFAGWDLSGATPGTTFGSLVGREINVSNRATPTTWLATPSGAPLRSGGLIINNDGTGAYPSTFGIWLARHTGGNSNPAVGGWWTGILLDGNSIQGDGVKGEGIRIRGAGTGFSAQLYGGLALGDDADAHVDAFSYGIRMKDATFGDNAAIWLDRGHRITFGQNKATSPYITVDENANMRFGGNISIRPIFRILSTSTTALSTNEMYFQRISNTILRANMRGDDGVTYKIDWNLTPA